MQCKRTVRRALAAVLAALAVLAGSAHASAEEDEVYLLLVKSKNRLYVMLNDTPVYTFPVATGRANHPTPEGTFRIVTKVVNPYYLPKRIPGGAPNNPLGTRWMGLSIGNGYKYGIHGTHSPHLLGLSVSSGCIRMRNEDVEFLFRHIPLQTRIVIVSR
jgi:lipoprotein-anchoring transpeptidase ErfK/SrfK